MTINVWEGKTTDDYKCVGRSKSVDLMDEEDYRDCSGNPGTSGILFKISSYSMIFIIFTAKKCDESLGFPDPTHGVMRAYIKNVWGLKYLNSLSFD